ncbi:MULTISPECIES: MIP/aquaporin family protein [unclassified Paenibacillus]|uniref:MIP/aquaporin family protein n=1 Tax=unclassified Paenibacillus TaxID=185978 RepID=UPI000839BADE|nr:MULTISPECIES: MIP/aquaporin family protein [unclassified Paenibacillus]NWL87094.1 aquaporin family protein [Paenibacillus sp. 79R4]
MSAFWGEFIGTMILIVLGGGVCAGVSLKRSYAANSGWIVITMGWGLAVAIGAYSVGTISGAHLNPALTLGLALIGDFPWSDVPLYMAAQMLGAIVGAIIVFLHYLPHWKVTDDPGAKLSVFATSPAVYHPFSNLMSEIIGTFVLVLGILAIGANQFTDGLNPLIVGFLIVSIGLSLGGATGYAINPARDLGPRIAHMLLPIPGKGSSNWRYAWIPVVGPLLGGSFGALFYKNMFLGRVDGTIWIVIGIAAVILLLSLLLFGKNAKRSVSM